MKRPLIVANWKMNKTIGESTRFVQELAQREFNPENVTVVVCPPFTSLAAVAEGLSGKKSILVGAQNCHWEDKGAFTGEISPAFLKELHCRYVIVGHSERRRIFGETNEHLARKVTAVVHSQMIPIYCVGESEEERKKNRTWEVISQQLDKGLGKTDPADFAMIVVAYEPVWAIGTGNTASPEQAQEVHQQIREWICRQKGNEVGKKVPILYGGSVTAANIPSLMQQEDIDGALVGGASLQVDSFVQIVNDAAPNSMRGLKR